MITIEEAAIYLVKAGVEDISLEWLCSVPLCCHDIIDAFVAEDLVYDDLNVYMNTDGGALIRFCPFCGSKIKDV